MSADDARTEALLRLAEYSLLMRMAIRDAVRDLGADPDVLTNSGVVVLIRAGTEDLFRPGDVAELTGLSSGGVTKLLDRLQGAGFIDRRYGEIESDARGVSIHLTREGERLVGRLSGAFEGRLGELEVTLKELSASVDEAR